MSTSPAAPALPILVVEDDAAIRRIVLAQLKALGYEAVGAPDGRVALALLDDGLRPGLLFTDMVMPGGMDGLELAAAVADRLPDVRVLFTSGYGHLGDVEDGRRPHVLDKPYPRAALAAKLAEVWAAAPYRD